MTANRRIPFAIAFARPFAIAFALPPASAVAVASALVCGACTPQSDPPPPATQGDAWNGGKPRAPFVVESPVSGPVAEDVDVPIGLTITPQKNCSQLATTVRGIDGVVVANQTGAPAHRTYPTCAAGATVTHPIVARLPAGTAGYVVVDVSAIVNGRSVQASYPIALRASNAAFARKSTGQVSVGANGERVVRMVAATR